jgi:predicted DNA-binding protein
MHGEKRGKKRASGKTARARPKASKRAAAPAKRGSATRSAPPGADLGAPLTLTISPRLSRGLHNLALRTDKPKHYHVRRALERYLEDTWDYLDAVESYESTKGQKTISLEELRKKWELLDRVQSGGRAANARTRTGHPRSA